MYCWFRRIQNKLIKMFSEEMDARLPTLSEFSICHSVAGFCKYIKHLVVAACTALMPDKNGVTCTTSRYRRANTKHMPASLRANVQCQKYYWTFLKDSGELNMCYLLWEGCRRSQKATVVCNSFIKCNDLPHMVTFSRRQHGLVHFPSAGTF